MTTLYIIIAIVFILNMYSTIYAFNKLRSYTNSLSKLDFLETMWITSSVTLLMLLLGSLFANTESAKLIKSNYKCPELERVENVYKIKR